MRAAPPPPTAVRPLIETLYGRSIADPYRWLEDSDDPETVAWTKAQNEYTRAHLDALPFRARLRERLGQLWSVGLLSAPAVRRGRCFYTRREADQDQPILYVRRDAAARDEVLVDPNVFGSGQLVTIDWWYPSWDGALVAYGLSRGGNELSTLHVIEVATRRVLAERIPETRFSTVAWLLDGSGFYYTRYPAPGTVPPGEEHYHKRVRFHRLGSDHAQDPVVFGEGRTATDVPWVTISRDGRWLLAHVQQGWAKQSLHILDLAAPAAGFRSLGEEHEAIFFGHVEDGRLFLHTNWDAPNWRVLELAPEEPELVEARTVLAERDDVILENVAYAGGRISASELEAASARVRVYGVDGTFEREVLLPGVGSVTGLEGEWSGSELFVGYHSFLTPATVLRADLRTGATGLFARLASPPDFKPDDYEVRQVRYRSKDGTAVPMFLILRRGVRPDGSHPTILYGYGGFNVNMTPAYFPTMPVWVESGGIFAVAVLRGGGEFGESWHRAGMLERKQNVFDDFLAASDWLVRERYASRDRMAIYGGSNGGLLVGAAITQRPDVARAAVCAVPLLDMLRYHHFRIAKLWMAEYGSPEDPEQVDWLAAYSPYHHVRDGERYPAILLTTALGDSRVDPMHARKMAARLQAASASDLPVLLRVEIEAGHGQGKPRWKQIEESTDIWSFFFWQLGVER